MVKTKVSPVKSPNKADKKPVKTPIKRRNKLKLKKIKKNNSINNITDNNAKNKTKNENTKKLKKKDKKKNFKKNRIRRQRIMDDDLNIMNYVMYEEEPECNIIHKFTTYNLPKSKEEQHKYVNELINKCDIILEVLDIRDIFHSRIPAKLETQIKSLGKNLVIVLNKIDLVNDNFLNKAVKKIESENKDITVLINSCYERDKILKFFNDLANYCTELKKGNLLNTKKNKAIQLGIIGYPNVGKGSIIHSLRLIPDANSEDRNIKFNTHKNLLIDYVPGTVIDDDEKNSLLISKINKNILDVPNPNELLNKICSIVDFKKSKIFNSLHNFNLIKNPDSFEELINLIINKFKYNEVYKDKEKEEINKIALQHIYRELINGNIYFEYFID